METGAPINLQDYMAKAQSQAQWAMQDSQRLASLQAQERTGLDSMLTQMLFGKSAGAMRSSGVFGEELAGHLAGQLGAAGMGILGMSPAQMMAASQNMASYGGMHISGPGGQSFGMVGNSTFSDVASSELWRQLHSNFTHPGGAPDLSRTHGASLDDVGAAINAMQQRGAFAGQQIGTFETLTADRLHALKSAASDSGDNALVSQLSQLKPGDTHVALNSGLAAQTTAWASETLKTIQELRSVLGDLPFGQIAGELERLTGTSLGRPQDMAYARQRLHSTLSSGAAAGLSPIESLEFNAATTQSIDAGLSARNGLPNGSFYSFSAAASPFVDRIAQAAYAEQRGGAASAHYVSRPMTEIAAVASNDMARMMHEAPEMTEALFMASKYDKGDARRAALLNSVAAYGEAGTVEQRESALRSMGRTFTQTTGLKSGGLINLMGEDSLMYQLQQDPDIIGHGVNAIMGSNQAAMGGEFRKLQAQWENPGVAAAFGGSEKAAEFNRAMFQQFTPAEIHSISQASSGDSAGVNARLENAMRGMNMPEGYTAQSMAAQLTQHNQNLINSAGMDLGNYLNTSQAMATALTPTASSVSVNGMRDHAKREQAHRVQGIFNKGVLPESVKQSMTQGFFGGDIPLDDQAFIAYQADKDKTSGTHDLLNMKINEDMGFDIDEKQAKELSDIMQRTKVGSANGIDVKKALGVKSDKELAAALADPTKAAWVTSVLASDKDQIAGISEDGSVSVAKDPNALRESYNKDVAGAKKAGSNTTLEQASQTGNNLQGSSKPVTINLNLIDMVRGLMSGTMKF